MKFRYIALAAAGIPLLVAIEVFFLALNRKSLLPDPLTSVAEIVTSAPTRAVVTVRVTPTPEGQEAAPTAVDLGLPLATPTGQPASPPASDGIAALAGPRLHTVGLRETLPSIAGQYGITAAELMAVNSLGAFDTLYVGQLLLIPPAPPAATPSATPTTPGPAALTATLAVPGPAAPASLASADDQGIVPTSIPAGPEAVSGVAVDTFIVMDDAVRRHIREIYARGLALGNNPRAFSKIGDSTTANPYFLAPFDAGLYDLGDYEYLQPAIDYFAGSFGRNSVVVRIGLHSWSVFDPMWSDPARCQSGEAPIVCEFRLHRPSIVFIRLGANDSGVPRLFADSMRQIVEYALDAGVIPILGTRPDQNDGAADSGNNLIRQIAAEYQVPLWDFDLIAQTIPGQGLGGDNVHMTALYRQDYTSPRAFQIGHSVHNLTALIALDRVWREVMQIGLQGRTFS